LTSIIAEVPKVILTDPTSTPSSPNIAACWSPARPASGTAASKMRASVSPQRALDGAIAGSTRSGMPIAASTAASQPPVRKSYSPVHDAFE
jgi:hypothetical protein